MRIVGCDVSLHAMENNKIVIYRIKKSNKTNQEKEGRKKRGCKNKTSVMKNKHRDKKEDTHHNLLNI